MRRNDPAYVGKIPLDVKEKKTLTFTFVSIAVTKELLFFFPPMLSSTIYIKTAVTSIAYSFNGLNSFGVTLMDFFFVKECK